MEYEDRCLVDWVLAQLPDALFQYYTVGCDVFCFIIPGGRIEVDREVVDDSRNDSGRMAQLRATLTVSVKASHVHRLRTSRTARRGAPPTDRR